MTAANGHPLQLEKLISGRGQDTDGQFTVFVEIIVGKAGCNVWKKSNMHTHLMSEVVSVADEAFAIMLLRNSWDRWVAMAKNEAVLPPTKWTMEEKDERSRVFSGWDVDALDRVWPATYAAVKKDHEENQDWEVSFRERKQAEANKEKNKKKPVSAPKRDVVVYTGFDDAANIPIPRYKQESEGVGAEDGRPAELPTDDDDDDDDGDNDSAVPKYPTEY